MNECEHEWDFANVTWAVVCRKCIKPKHELDVATLQSKLDECADKHLILAGKYSDTVDQLLAVKSKLTIATTALKNIRDLKNLVDDKDPTIYGSIKKTARQALKEISEETK